MGVEDLLVDLVERADLLVRSVEDEDVQPSEYGHRLLNQPLPFVELEYVGFHGHSLALAQGVDLLHDRFSCLRALEVVHGDRRPVRRETFRNLCAYAARCAGDKGDLSGERKRHGEIWMDNWREVRPGMDLSGTGSEVNNPQGPI